MEVVFKKRLFKAELKQGDWIVGKDFEQVFEEMKQGLLMIAERRGTQTAQRLGDAVVSILDGLKDAPGVARGKRRAGLPPGFTTAQAPERILNKGTEGRGAQLTARQDISQQNRKSTATTASAPPIGAKEIATPFEHVRTPLRHSPTESRGK